MMLTAPNVVRQPIDPEFTMAPRKARDFHTREAAATFARLYYTPDLPMRYTPILLKYRVHGHQVQKWAVLLELEDENCYVGRGEWPPPTDMHTILARLYPDYQCAPTDSATAP